MYVSMCIYVYVCQNVYMYVYLRILCMYVCTVMPRYNAVTGMQVYIPRYKRGALYHFWSFVTDAADR